MQKICNAIWLLLIVLISSGCNTILKKESNLTENARNKLWKVRQQELTQFNDWELEAQLGLKVAEQYGIVSLEWQQIGDSYIIYLDDPFGQSIVKIKGKPHSVELEAFRKIYNGHNPEQLLFALTGWKLPIRSLRYWMIGMPSPISIATLRLNYEGNLVRIHQHGWIIEYLQYKKISGVNMPYRMIIRQGNMQATLVFRSWRLK